MPSVFFEASNEGRVMDIPRYQPGVVTQAGICRRSMDGVGRTHNLVLVPSEKAERALGV